MLPEKYIEVEIAPGMKHIGLVQGDYVTLDFVKIITDTAQGILDARALYPDMTLADMYDEAKMPSELRMAHELNDRAVMEAYGFASEGVHDADIVKQLIEMYDNLVGNGGASNG